MIPWAALDMAHEADRFKANRSRMVSKEGKIPREMKDLDWRGQTASVFRHRQGLPEN